MGDHNSLTLAKQFAGVLIVLIKRDLNRLWQSDKHVEMDAMQIARRSRAEGISFLTKTLPTLGKALDCALSSDTPFEAPSGFQTQKDSKLPIFLGDLFRSVFDDRGELLPVADAPRGSLDVNRMRAQAMAVAGIRQIAYMFYKLKLEYTDHETRRVIDQFRDVEQELATQGDPDPDSDRVLFAARRLISAVCCNINPREAVPRHGPGSVATGESVLQKSKFSRIYSSVERFFPFTEYFRFGLAHVADTYHEIQQLEVIDAPCAKITLVPKDSRGPRIISMEPLEVQWLQQGLRALLYTAVEEHPLTKGHVSFTDQSINRRLAQQNSITGEFATIDMKDASDRVSLKLVRCLFGHTALLEALEATRSHYTQLPDSSVMFLNKFAPMGSALCFPVEALVFWSIAVSVLHVVVGMRLRDAISSVYVYGDDIVLPAKHWKSVAAAYGALNLEVNTSKCCVSQRGIFRESCGLDAMWGHDVTPIRIKNVPNRHLASWVPAYVKQSNLFYERGYHATADVLEKMVREHCGDIPLVDHKNSHLGLAFVRSYACPELNPARIRYNKRLQRLEVRSYVMKAKQHTPLYGGYDRLLRHWAEKLGSSTVARTIMTPQDRDEDPLYSERRRAVMRRTWLPYFN